MQVLGPRRTASGSAGSQMHKKRMIVIASAGRMKIAEGDQSRPLSAQATVVVSGRLIGGLSSDGIHLLAQRQRTHVCPHFLDVLQAFLLRTALAGILPA